MNAPNCLSQSLLQPFRNPATGVLTSTNLILVYAIGAGINNKAAGTKLAFQWILVKGSKLCSFQKLLQDVEKPCEPYVSHYWVICMPARSSQPSLWNQTLIFCHPLQPVERAGI